jgi:M6 family metalloprotease-like protein
LQAHFSEGTRCARFLIPGFLLVVGAALGAALPAVSLGAGQDDGHGHYHRLPVVGRDWTAVGDQPDGPVRLQREQFRQGEYFRRWQAIHRMFGPQHVSRKGQEILAKRGLGKALLEEGASGPRAFTGVDTLKVLLIRIGFETNRDSNLTTIDPGGDFVLVPPEDPEALHIDPPPHNKSFYESHLQGLSEYYDYQSGGRLHIQGEVLPPGEDDSYKLSDVADYGPGTDGFWTIESLERLVRDMIVKADEETAADGSANLSDYDDNDPFTYIIFVHAGSDWQSDINGNSPNDIPTFFVTLGEVQDLPASGGALSECSIIPETTNQDGYPGSIAAAFYHEFGHALGLVDVYNTTTGLPQVGIWDLMDSGTNLPVVIGQEEVDGELTFITAVGVLPPSLGVWNKWFLGWVEMEEVDGRQEDYLLPAVQVPRDQYPMWDARSGDFDLGYPQAIKAGPSSREYFLLENRYVPFPDSTSTYTPYSGFAFERDEATGVILYLAGERAGSWSNTGLYDFFLPAGGLLAWHVNNDRIAANLETNTINAFGDGLRLLEADGIQDIGVLDSYVLGWYGSWRDPFGEENGFQNIYTDAFPSSRMHDRSWSGLAVTDIRQENHRSASVMQFAASIEPYAPGFPWEVAAVDSALAASAGGVRSPRALDTASLTPVAAGDAEFLILADRPGPVWAGARYPGALFALNRDGSPRYGGVEGRPEGAFQALDGPLAGSPVLVDGHSGAETAVAWTTRGGTLGLSTFPAAGDPGGWSSTLSDSLVSGPLPLGQAGDLRVAVLAAPDSLYLVDGTGQLTKSLSLAETVGLPGATWLAEPRLLGYPQPTSLVVFLDAGFTVIDLVDGNPVVHAVTSFPRPISGGLHSALDSGAEGARLCLFDDDGSLGVWSISADGYISQQEPLDLDQPLVCEPAVADLDGDGRNDLVLLTATHIHAYQRSGINVRGFPVRFYDLFPLDPDTRITGPAVVADATGDGVNEILFNTDGGHLVGLTALGRLLEGTPFLWGDAAAAGLAVGGPDAATGQRILYLVSEGGYAGEPMGRQFYNGRVGGYSLTAPGAGTRTTSGWFGTAGGALRAGAEGEPQDLGQVAPAAAEQDLAYLFPNPLRDRYVTLRFHAGQAGQALFELYNLQGERVSSETFPVAGGVVVEQQIDCSGTSSGIYLGRLVYPGASGNIMKTMTLAVER